MTSAPTTAALPTALAELLEAAERHGDRELVHWVDDGTRTSYRDACESAARWAAVFAAHGVAAGDRVALLLPNSRAFVGALFGAWSCGAVVAPLNTELRGESLRHPLRLYRPAVVVLAPHLADRVRQAAEPETVLIEVDGSPPAGAEPTTSPSAPATTMQDPCLIMSTSGTTGPSKGTVWDFGTLRQWVDTYVLHLRYDRRDRIYCCTPLFHANALASGLLTALRVGATVVLAERFSVSRFWDHIARSRATSANLLGSMIDLLLAHGTGGPDDPAGPRGPSSLRTMLVSSCSERAYRGMQERWRITPVSACGLTDFGTITAGDFGGEAPPGGVGRPVDGYEVRLVDEMDEEVPPGRPGELLVRTRRPWTAPSGYFGMPEETLASRRDLWFRTGDLLRVEQGWWYFAGRVKDSMRRRGENVSAYEIEQAAGSVPEVAEAAAYPVPADGSEDEIALAIVTAAGADPVDPRALLETEDTWDAVREGFRVMRDGEA